MPERVANGQPTLSLIGTGSNPTAVAVNPVTNQVFVVNYASNNMTIFDPITGKTVTVAVGSRPSAVVVNPVTNMAYVANEYNVIAIDGKNPTATQTIRSR